MEPNPVERAIRAAGVTKQKLSQELGIGTTTIWRACTGRRIDADSARKLRARFPELDFEALTLGSETAASGAESGEHPAVDVDPEPAAETAR